MDGAAAMTLACRLPEQGRYAPDGTPIGSVATRAKEARDNEIWAVYKPDQENDVMDEDDLKRLVQSEELEATDFDWS